MNDEIMSLPSDEWNDARECIPDFLRTTDGRAMLMTPLVEIKTHRGKIVRAFARFDYHDPETGDVLKWEHPVKNREGETEMWSDDHIVSWRPDINSPDRDVKPFSILHAPKNELIRSPTSESFVGQRAKIAAQIMATLVGQRYNNVSIKLNFAFDLEPARSREQILNEIAADAVAATDALIRQLSNDNPTIGN